MATPVPIPPDLWRRLAARDARCDFSMERRSTDRPTKMLTSRKNYPREWDVRIGEKGDPRGPLSVEGAALREVLAAAAAEAEQRGWR